MSGKDLEGAAIKLVGPYWADSEGNGKAYTKAIGWPDLYIGEIREGAVKPLRICQSGKKGTIGWCNWESTRPDCPVGP